MSDGLNAAQRTAVHTLSGPLLVLAGAGTGKTRVVTYRIAELIKHGTPPDRILAVTFTNKAAKEMQQRAGALLGRTRKTRPEISTFHSLCVRILRRHATRLGYPERFAIYDRGDQESAARAALREIHAPETALRPGDLIYMISAWKTQGLRPQAAASAARSDKEHLAAVAYRRYQAALKLAGGIDFDDLLLCSEELFDRFPAVREQEAARYSHLLIDEYQDTNAVQYRIVRALALPHRNLCVVGDDDQSIYGWRGAEVAHILRFERDWPDAKVVRLEENYRSTEAILTLANRLIRYNRLRHDKVLRPARAGGEKPRILQCRDEEDEARTVVEDIRARMEAGLGEPRDFAILFRTNEQPRAFETQLRKAKLPYVLVGGMSFFDRREVRDILAYLRLLVTPTDEVALRRVLNVPARGIGARGIEALVAAAVAAGRPTWDIVCRPESCADLPPAAHGSVRQFERLIKDFAQRCDREKLADVATALVDAIGYRKEIERNYKDPQEQLARWAAVEEVVNSLAAYQSRERRPTLPGFLDEIALGDRDNDRDKEQQLNRNAIALMTLHSAKGLEFPQVYLVGLEEQLLPHRKSVEAEGTAIDEERRLCYVGITRAKDRLTISMALSRMKWGKPRETKPSRFLFEISGQSEHPKRPLARAGTGSKSKSQGAPRPKLR